MGVPQSLLEAFPTFVDPPDTSPPPSGSGEQGLGLGPPPGRFDWRDDGILSPVRFQGSCNTCTSFAAAAAIESAFRLRTSRGIRLAPGYIHSCLLQRDCRYGAASEEVLPAAKSNGIALGFDGDYPFPMDRCLNAERLPLQHWAWLEEVDVVLAWIASEGPVIADMHVGRTSFPRLRAGDIYRVPPGEETLLHSVVVVGYDRGAGWALVQNSFGPGWADRGFGMVAIGSGNFLDYRGAFRVAA